MSDVLALRRVEELLGVEPLERVSLALDQPSGEVLLTVRGDRALSTMALGADEARRVGAGLIRLAGATELRQRPGGAVSVEGDLTPRDRRVIEAYMANRKASPDAAIVALIRALLNERADA